MKLMAKLCLCVVLAAAFFSCSKYEKKGWFDEGGVALTFDDAYIANWTNYLPFLDSCNIKATFYICKYHTLTAAEI